MEYEWQKLILAVTV